MFRCARIQGLDTCEGLLLFGKEHFYVVDGFTILKTREIKDIDSLPVKYVSIYFFSYSEQIYNCMHKCFCNFTSI